jgi:hypothetical protein
MSDHEDDDDEEEEEEEDDGRARKPIPDWARGPALEATIHAQFGEGGPDADKLFSTF